MRGALSGYQTKWPRTSSAAAGFDAERARAWSLPGAASGSGSKPSSASAPSPFTSTESSRSRRARHRSRNKHAPLRTKINGLAR